jgi:amidase
MNPFTSLCDIASLLRSGRVSAREVVAAALWRIERLDGALSAFISVARERALADAAALDESRGRGEPLGRLHGVPIAVKDTLETARIPTSYGLEVFRGSVPVEDQLCVARLRAEGAVVIGKTSTPPLGVGPVTVNALSGVCRNPHDPTRTPGGSSGGSAAAVAACLCAGAVGSDLGGSLRTPASFCGIVAFRASPGRVPQYPRATAWETLNVNGPMTRSVRDAALMLVVMAGPDARDPTSFAEQAHGLLLPPEPAPVRDLRVAWSPDLGWAPVQRSIRAVCGAAVARLARAGWAIEEAHPDVSDALEAWIPVRAAAVLSAHHRVVAEHRELIDADVVANVERGVALTALALGRAEQARTRLFHLWRQFFTRYDLLLTPTVGVEPWLVEQWLPADVDGIPMSDYYAWQALNWTVSTVGLPALSLPCGRTDTGLPVGLQLVGPYKGERAVLAAAQAIEAELALDSRPPAPFGA